MLGKQVAELHICTRAESFGFAPSSTTMPSIDDADRIDVRVRVGVRVGIGVRVGVGLAARGGVVALVAATEDDDRQDQGKRAHGEPSRVPPLNVLTMRA